MSDTTGEAAQKPEEVIEIDSADGRGFVPMDQITQKVGEIGIEQQQEEEEEEDPLADLPKKVLIRLEALKKLQENQADLETEFEKERKLLELKYEKLYQPLYQERAQIVAGTKEVEGISSLTPEEAQENVKGIPGFWVRALMNHSIVEQIITERDLPALEHLIDVRSTSHEENNGFKLEFEFAPNPFFDNKVLTKEYDVTEATESGDAMLRNIVGTEIQWKSKQNLCESTKKVKQRAKGSKETRVVSRTEPCESFFQFFSPVEMPTEEDDEESEMIMRQLDTDFQIGFTIHESIIPQAVLWFTGEAEEADNSEYDPEEDEECEEDDSEEDDDEDYEEESDEENVPVQKKKSGKQQGKKKFPALEPGANTEKPPECKNQ